MQLKDLKAGDIVVNASRLVIYLSALTLNKFKGYFICSCTVDDFIKKTSIISYSRDALKEVYKDVMQFAECEKLTAHANSVGVRFEDED